MGEENGGVVVSIGPKVEQTVTVTMPFSRAVDLIQTLGRANTSYDVYSALYDAGVREHLTVSQEA